VPACQLAQLRRLRLPQLRHRNVLQKRVYPFFSFDLNGCIRLPFPPLKQGYPTFNGYIRLFALRMQHLARWGTWRHQDWFWHLPGATHWKRGKGACGGPVVCAPGTLRSCSRSSWGAPRWRPPAPAAPRLRLGLDHTTQRRKGARSSNVTLTELPFS